MTSTTAPSFCTSTSYLASFDIYNALYYTSLNASQRLSTLLGSQPSNISIYPFGATSIVPGNFTYGLLAFPLLKPLSIQCPVPACVFPVSGYFAFLQRVLCYVNIILAAFVVFYLHILRGIAQIWLTTICFSAVALVAVNIFTTGTPLIYNLDLIPALLIIHIGLLPTLMWFAFRADRRGTENLLPTARWNWKRIQGRLSHHPMTLFALSLYGSFLVLELVIGRKTQNSTTHGFWPLPTAVIVESDTLSLVLCALMVLLSLTSLKELGNIFDRPKRHIFTSSLPTALTYASKFSSRRTASWWIAVIPFFISMLMAGVVVIFLVARYEQRSTSASIPTGEDMFEIGQWAPWITEFLAIFLVMMAKWLGWPFREAESEPTWQANENNEEDVQGQGTRAESIPLTIIF